MSKRKIDTIKVTIADEGASIEPKILSEFLMLFEACVVASAEQGLDWNGKGALPPNISEDFQRISPLKWNEYFDRNAPELLTIESISRNSPIEIAMSCAIGLVTVAVIFSGGKIKVGPKGIEATLPPLGTGIAALKKALGLAGRVTSAYSIRTIIIKLNSAEVAALLQQDPSQKNKGGFQNFLIGLQTRLNRSTKELVLSDVDLERIIRYKSDPKKGGFQSRFRKIFGRHFPAD